MLEIKNFLDTVASVVEVTFVQNTRTSSVQHADKKQNSVQKRAKISPLKMPYHLDTIWVTVLE
jgi:hypothetical protein